MTLTPEQQRAWRKAHPDKMQMYCRTGHETLKRQHTEAIANGDNWHCTMCEQDKPASEFYWANKSRCRECSQIRARASYARKRDADK